MTRAYRFLLLLYPREHRDRFAEEMTGVFEEACADRRAQGWGWYLRFAFGEMNGLVAGAADAWLARNSAPPEPLANAGPNSLPLELAAAQKRVDLSIAGMVHAIAHHQFEHARRYSYEERQAREELQALRGKNSRNNPEL